MEKKLREDEFSSTTMRRIIFTVPDLRVKRLRNFLFPEVWSRFTSAPKAVKDKIHVNNSIFLRFIQDAWIEIDPNLTELAFIELTQLAGSAERNRIAQGKKRQKVKENATSAQ